MGVESNINIFYFGLVVAHYSHREATQALPTVSEKSKCTHWQRGNSELSEQSTFSHHSWRQ